MSNESRNWREALLRLADAHADDVLSAPQDEIIAEAEELGIDIEAEGELMRDLLRRAQVQLGKARMAAARAELEEARQGRRIAPASHATGAPSLPRPANDAQMLTLAARNGREQSDRDKQTIQDDLNELEALERGGKDA